MKKPSAALILVLAVGMTQTACQPQKQASNAGEEQAQFDAIKAELILMKSELKQVSAQVKDIHNIATASTRPETRKLASLSEQELAHDTPILGNPKAEIVIVEFSDFQCPYCKRFLDSTFNQIKQSYIDSGKVKYLAKNFPLSFHANAEGAAIAAYCSGKQDAYWPMRDKLFSNITALSDGLYTRLATELKLDMKQFDVCLDSPKSKELVLADRALGTKLGIAGTPSFVIGKLKDNQLVDPELLVGAQNFDAFSALIAPLQDTP